MRSARTFRTRALAAAASVVAVGVPAGTVSAGAAASAGAIRPAALAPRLPPGATRLGPLDPTRPLAFDVVLAPSHADELAALLRDLYDPASPRYEQWLAPGEFARRFGPDPAAVDAVVGWLHGVGLRDTDAVDGRVEVHTTARAAARGLGLSFSQYRAANGAQTFAADRAPLVPRAIAPAVTAIVGLSDTTPWQPHLKIRAELGPSPSAAAGSATSCERSIQRQANELDGWTTRQNSVRYQVPDLLRAGLTGAGKTVALYELAPHTASDVSTYFRCFGLHNPVQTKKVDGGAFGHDPGGTFEANLDIEAAAVTAPGAKLISYEGPNSLLGALHVWSAMVHDDAAPAISTSWGRCELSESASERNTMHALFVQAAAQGQSIFSASGDSGSAGCLFQNGSQVLSVDSPSNDPLLTAVGGTSLLPRHAPSDPYREPAWNDCQDATSSSCSFSGGAGGGGASQEFARPSWQPRGASPCASCRGVPDLAANAGVGEAFTSGARWALVGGTSIAAPRLAGIAADVAGGCVNRLGSFNPRVYAIAKAGGYGVALRDVPVGQGDNDLTKTNGRLYPTAVGFDLVTGLGTPLSTGLVCPEVALVRPATAAPGTRVTIVGLGLAHATITFGGTAARVVSANTTSATVVVPGGSGRVTVGASDPMGRGTYRAAFTYAGG